METSIVEGVDKTHVMIGDSSKLPTLVQELEQIPVDWDLSHLKPEPIRAQAQTIQKSVTVSGRGTFQGKNQSTIKLWPSNKPGWRFQRADYPDCLPVRVSADNVWTTGDIVSNIVLRSGPPHNYVRMVEHMIALKLGLPIDSLIIEITSGDPPLFNRGSMDLVDAVNQAGIRPVDGQPVRYFTVKEPVAAVHPGGGGFLIFEPCDPDDPALTFDCAVNFENAIGQQRIKFPMNSETFHRGAEARTNTSQSKMIFCQTLGKLFADIRNLGYSSDNILIAGKNKYYNEPQLMHGDKSLEAVWHRTVLDLAAALSLIEEGRFLGKITSYRAGHQLDVELVCKLYKYDLLQELHLEPTPLDQPEPEPHPPAESVA